MQDKIKENFLRIQEEIAPYKPKIIAVTKYFDRNAIIDAYNAGLRNFAESRVVEATEKINGLPEEIKMNSKFHFIGHLQTNKVKKALETFDLIHSVDSVKLAQKISEEAKILGKTQKILLEVNNANEPQKYGFSKKEILESFSDLKNLENIEIAGLMNMAPLGADESKLFEVFTELVEIRNTLQREHNCELKEVSMGMSQDYKIAAKAGSTMLRIGRKLFE